MAIPSAEASAPVEPPGGWALALWNIASAVALFLLGWCNLALLDRYPALIGWLPAGFGLGLVLIKGPRLLPGVFLGVVSIGLLGFHDLARATLLGAESMLTCTATWYVLNRRHLFDLAQRRISDVGLMLLVAALLSTTVASISGPRQWTATSVAAPAPVVAHAPSPHAGGIAHGAPASPAAHAAHAAQAQPMAMAMPAVDASPHAASPDHPAAPSPLAWVLADAIGILLVVPLALRGYRWSLSAEPRLTRKTLAACAILAVLVGVSVGIYGGLLEERYGIRHTTLLILPPAVWLALKHDLGFTLAGNFFVFLIAGVGTSLGHGPFNDHTAGLPLLTFITLFTTLLIAAGRTERKVAEATIQRMVSQDLLTGLPNRHALNQRLAQALGNARRYQRSVAVVFIDLDNFKRANDSFGHEIGDRLLVEAARKLSGCLRGDSMLARFGGDEFIALIDHVDHPTTLDAVGQRMIDALAAPIVIDGHECKISCSGGIAVFPGDGDNAGDLLKNADIAMYHIKSRGRNGFQLYSRMLPESGRMPVDRRTAQA